MFLKLCGLRRAEDIQAVNASPPDYIGFVFADSPRRVSISQAANLRMHLHAAIGVVGVFVNEALDTVLETVRVVGLSVVQLHGQEDADYVETLHNKCSGLAVWKAVRFTGRQDIIEGERTGADALLVDAAVPGIAGGSGKRADWELLQTCRGMISLPLILAGGLSADNLAQAQLQLHPDGFDLSSGIETGCMKDPQKIKQVVELFTAIKNSCNL